MTIMRKGDTAALKEQGMRLGRVGLAQRVIDLVDEFQANPTYIGAIRRAGRLSAITVACKVDDYWNEKAQDGWHREMHALHGLKQPAQADDKAL